MNLQKTTQYALKILSLMALSPEYPHTADQISNDTQIPKRYLRRLMTGLSRAGFLKVSRGRTGGFSFARDISGITLYEIIECFEEETFMDRCILGFTFCIADVPCVLHEQWIEAQDQTLKVLKTTTLGSLREKFLEAGKIESQSDRTKPIKRR